MKHILRILIAVLLVSLLLTGCNKTNSEQRSINVNELSYNYTFINKNYPNYEHIFKSNMYSTSSMYNEIFQICNEYREEKGIKSLEFNTDLTVIAGIRALEIAEAKKYEHQRPNGLSFSSVYEEYGINLSEHTVAENIGEKYNTAKEICQSWKNSESHYETIINHEYTQIGIGIAITEDGEYVFVEEFM